MKKDKSKSTIVIPVTIFIWIMILLSLGLWVTLCTIVGQAWLLPITVGILLTVLSFYELGRYFKGKHKNGTSY